MVREEFNLKLRKIDGKQNKTKKFLFPLVALQCMPTPQLPADEKSWFTLLLKEKKKTVLIIYSSYN